MSECVKILALERGILESSTLGRLAQLERLGAITEENRCEIQQAFEHLLAIRLRHQVDEHETDRLHSSHVDPFALSAEERDTLRRSLLVAKPLEEMLRRRHHLA